MIVNSQQSLSMTIKHSITMISQHLIPVIIYHSVLVNNISNPQLDIPQSLYNQAITFKSINSLSSVNLKLNDQSLTNP